MRFFNQEIDMINMRISDDEAEDTYMARCDNLQTTDLMGVCAYLSERGADILAIEAGDVTRGVRRCAEVLFKDAPYPEQVVQVMANFIVRHRPDAYMVVYTLCYYHEFTGEPQQENIEVYHKAARAYMGETYDPEKPWYVTKDD